MILKWARQAIDFYSYGLKTVSLDLGGFNDRLSKLPYIQKIRFFIYLRQWVNENNNDQRDKIELAIGQIMDKVEIFYHAKIEPI